MFDNLPKDPIILLSVINTKLRDHYASLAALCDDLDANEGDIKARLGAVGYVYDPTQNRFI